MATRRYGKLMNLRSYQKQQGKMWSSPIRRLAACAEKDIQKLLNRLDRKDVEICKLNREIIELRKQVRDSGGSPQL